MIEKEIENKIKQAMENALSAYDGIEYIGSWDIDNSKGNEDKGTKAIVSIKTSPRKYDTPTIPTTTIESTIGLVVRADEDYTGLNYIELTEKIMKSIQEWQDDFNSFYDTFNLSSFETTGFQITGGDNGCDSSKTIWTFRESILMYGVVK